VGRDFVNVVSAENCVVVERYIRYSCDRRMWRYSITVIADVELSCKLILACGVRINPAQGFNRICRRAPCFNSDTVVPHSAIPGIAESYNVE
jgi:hypothetical protein